MINKKLQDMYVVMNKTAGVSSFLGKLKFGNIYCLLMKIHVRERIFVL